MTWDSRETVSVWEGDWRADPRINLPQGRSEFVVGDIHGCADQLDALFGTLAPHAAGAQDPHLTFLGDLVDRGPESLRCVALAAGAAARLGTAATLLMGNHEAMMLAAALVRPTWLSAPAHVWAWEAWLGNGGMGVLREMGYPPPGGEGETAAAARLRDGLLAGLGGPAMRFLEGAGTHRVAGNLLLCHAGIPPARPRRNGFPPPPGRSTGSRIRGAGCASHS